MLYCQRGGINLSSVTYTLNEEKYTADFTDGKTVEITEGENVFTLTVVQTGVASLHFNIDESYGTITDMRTSKDHSAKCYGDFQMTVPADIAEENRCDTEYIGVENDDTKPGVVELRGRGNRSWQYAIEGYQPSYQFKLEKKQDLLGMGESKTWCLIGTAAKSQFMSNKFFLDLARDMGILYTTNTAFVDVYINGVYDGFYVLTEKTEIGSSRVDISDLDDEIEELGKGENVSDLDLTGGYLLEIDNAKETIQFQAQDLDFTIKSPETLDTKVTASNNYSYIVNYTRDFMNAVYGDGYMSDGRHFMDAIDVDSFVKYFWLCEFSGNTDATSGSTFLYKDKDEVDPLLHMCTAWDFNIAFVNETLQTRWMFTSQNKIFSHMMKHKEFASYCFAYYKDNYMQNGIRDTYIKHINMVPDYVDELTVGAEMSSIRWPYMYTFTPITNRNYMCTKVDWIDDNVDSLLDYATTGEYLDLGGNSNLSCIESYDFRNGEIGENLEEIYGSKKEGYGERAKLFASVNGTDLKAVEWGESRYIDPTGDTYIPAVISASEKNQWGEPYAEFRLSTVGLSNIFFDAKLAASKSGPGSYKLQYSTDGVNYTDIDGTEYTLRNNKKFEKVFNMVNIPAEIENCETAYIRIALASDKTVSGALISDAPTGGEIALGEIAIYANDSSVIPERPIPSYVPIMERDYWEGNVDKTKVQYGRISGTSKAIYTNRTFAGNYTYELRLTNNYHAKGNLAIALFNYADGDNYMGVILRGTGGTGFRFRTNGITTDKYFSTTVSDVFSCKLRVNYNSDNGEIQVYEIVNGEPNLLYELSDEQYKNKSGMIGFNHQYGNYSAYMMRLYSEADILVDNAVIDSDVLTADVDCIRDGEYTFYCASYDAQDEMIEVNSQTMDLDANEQIVYLQNVTPIAEKIVLYTWEGKTFKPCIKKTVVK